MFKTEPSELDYEKNDKKWFEDWSQCKVDMCDKKLKFRQGYQGKYGPLFSGLVARKPSSGVCKTTKRRPACASTQSDQRLCYSLFRKYDI